MSWPRPTQLYLNKVADDFKNDLKSVATALANHDKVDTVSTKHVDEAFSALSRSGLSCRPFYKRPEIWTALGGVLVGFSFSIPDVASSAADWAQLPWIAKTGFPCFVFSLITGMVVFICGVATAYVPRAVLKDETETTKPKRQARSPGGTPQAAMAQEAPAEPQSETAPQ